MLLCLECLLPEEQASFLMNVSNLLKPNGHILLFAEIYSMKDLEFIKFTKKKPINVS
jgi:hypothetical protein